MANRKAQKLGSFIKDLISRAEAHSECSQIPKMELFVKIVTDYKLLTIIAKSSVLAVWQGSEYISALFQDNDQTTFFLNCNFPQIRKARLELW